MDRTETLLTETLTDIASQAPAPRGIPATAVPVQHPRRKLAVFAIAASVCLIAVVIPFAVNVVGESSTPIPPDFRPHSAPGAPDLMPTSIAPGSSLWISADRRTVFIQVLEGSTSRGSRCWTRYVGDSQLGPHGVLHVTMLQPVVGGPAYRCLAMGVGGPWYVAFPLAQPYRRPLVVDGVNGERRRIEGVRTPTQGQLVNIPDSQVLPPPREPTAGP